MLVLEPFPVWITTDRPAPRGNVPNLYTWPWASRSVHPVRERDVAEVFFSVTYSALRLVFVRVSLPGESYWILPMRTGLAAFAGSGVATRAAAATMNRRRARFMPFRI